METGDRHQVFWRSPEAVDGRIIVLYVEEWKMSNYWNEEDSENIVCPYCGKEYEPTYEDTYIDGEHVDCFTMDENTYTCDECGKKFIMRGYEAGWRYQTETIDGEATEEEVEERTWR